MADTLARIESSLRTQQQVLLELIEVALSAVRESGDTSVSAMHLNTRLRALADLLEVSDAASAALPPTPVRKAG